MDDPDLRPAGPTSNYKVLEPILNEAMKMKTTQEWVEELEQLGIPCGPVNMKLQSLLGIWQVDLYGPA